MKLFLVEYCNGAEYDDWMQFFVGVYSTRTLADEAAKLALIVYGGRFGRAYCDIDEVIVNKMPEEKK